MSRKLYTIMNTKNKPLFIAIEGGDGSGKSTIIQKIKERLGDNVLITREPGGSPYAEDIRTLALKHNLADQADPRTMMCLMFAARFDHVKNTILPALKSGKDVITDRFDASTFAYQIHAQKGGAELEKLFWQLRYSLDVLPDWYLYADVETEEGLKRVKARNGTITDGNHFDDQNIAFHNRLRAGYEQFFKTTGIKSLRIDANQDLENVHEQVLTIIGRLID